MITLIIAKINDKYKKAQPQKKQHTAIQLGLSTYFLKKTYYKCMNFQIL